ncbi:MAG TPA: AAA domain-containing protein [Methylomirabilota bacterium]|nr:AAA domain-containing protein [Methylomirabilota bacterium]
MATINFDINSLTFNQSENHEQRAARNRIKLESTIPITGPPGTGKSTVISSCCFELVNEYSPVLVVTPTNSMVNSILAKIDGLARSSNLRLPRGFIIRYGNVTELNYSYPHLNSYTLDSLVLQHQSNNGGGISRIRAGIDLMQNARIILCTDYIAKDLKNIIQAGAVLIDEAGLVSLDKMGTIFSSLRDNNGKVIVIGDDKQLPPPSHDYVATSLFRSILNHFSSTLLRKEYRFNKDILDLINPYYDNKLVADYSVQDISTADIAEKDYQGINDNLRKILQHDKKIVFVDTNDDRREDKHFVNPGEVSIIKDILKGCQSIGINSIMVITPYKQQERMLQLQLQQQDMQAIRIGTVDKFQGQEAEVAIISMVRSNTKQDYHEAIGFLNNSRACVAFSRGKRKTIIVGDQTTLIKNKFLARSIDTITRKDGFFIWRNSN